jgi:hypothetical protein
MTGRLFRAAALAALLAAAALGFSAAGCGRKAKPEPRTASPVSGPAPQYHIAREATCTISL